MAVLHRKLRLVEISGYDAGLVLRSSHEIIEHQEGIDLLPAVDQPFGICAVITTIERPSTVTETWASA